ncbi:MAG: hypothetical protein LBI01_01305 [Elusimicrobium sp.]|jgi:hypothetical protein|nr:hypothetical protein [Elusimicrobium sp.]
MKKTVILAAALLLAVAAKAQTVGTQESCNNYQKDCQSLTKTTCTTLTDAVKSGNEVCVETLTEDNHYSLDELVRAFDTAPAAAQGIRDHLYSRALTKMVADATVVEKTEDDRVSQSSAGAYAASSGSNLYYKIDYRKYYAKDNQNYSKQSVSLQNRQEAIDLLRPVLWDFLVANSAYKKDALTMVTKGVLEGKKWREAHKVTADNFIMQPSKEAREKSVAVKDVISSDFDRYMLKS